MITRNSIDLSSDYNGGDAFAVDDGLLTIQIDYANIDGDLDVVPMQTNDDTDYGPISDENGEAIKLRVRNHPGAKKTSSGTRFLNLSEIRCLKVKVLIKNLTNTAGTANLTIKNSESET